MSEIKFLTAKQVMMRYQFSRGTLYKLISEGRFPRQRKLGSRMARWLIDDLFECVCGVESRHAD